VQWISIWFALGACGDDGTTLDDGGPEPGTDAAVLQGEDAGMQPDEDAGPRSDAGEETTAGTIFRDDIENGSLAEIFVAGVNTYGGVGVEISTEVAHSGTRSVRIRYPNDEAGVELHAAPFAETPSLFTRKYELYASGWEGNWPVGLKTARYFTRPDFTFGTEGDAYAYMSEKLVWQTYDSTCDEEFALGMNNAIYDLDLEDTYGADETFGNGLPYIRTEHWYEFETWMVMNSAVDAADGVLQVWIDDVLVYSNENVVWRSTERGVPNGDGWQSMWFGGNYSGAICGGPSVTLDRYIDDVYLSTTLDR
jgi:hypothetical protein